MSDPEGVLAALCLPMRRTGAVQNITHEEGHTEEPAERQKHRSARNALCPGESSRVESRNGCDVKKSHQTLLILAMAQTSKIAKCDLAKADTRLAHGDYKVHKHKGQFQDQDVHPGKNEMRRFESSKVRSAQSETLESHLP